MKNFVVVWYRSINLFNFELLLKAQLEWELINLLCLDLLLISNNMKDLFYNENRQHIHNFFDLKLNKLYFNIITITDEEF